MVAITYGVTSPAVADSKSAGKSKGVFTMMFEAIAASQMKKAEAEVARYRHLLARDDNEELPFGGR
jgi:hypothetical protein